MCHSGTIWLIAFYFFCVFILSVDSHGSHKKPKVLIISFDGLRHDYLELAEKHNVDVSNFQKFRNESVHPTHIVPVYPSSTMPNHWAVMTGLYPYINGMVDNNFYDSKLNKTFDFERADYISDPKWYDNLNLKPLWLINQDNGYMSSSMMWPATAVTINGTTPKFLYGIDRFDDYPSVEYRIDKILEWLAVSDDSNLGFLYFPEPDEVGHRTGPASKTVFDKLTYLNKGVGYLRQRIEQMDLDTLNVLFWSDHGMTEVDPSKEIYFEDLLDNPSDAFAVNNNVWPAKGKFKQVYNALKKNENHYKVYKRDEPPKNLLYGRHYRIGDLFMVLDLGYYLLQNKSQTRKDRSYEWTLLGSHGYEVTNSDMWPYFMAWGPAFKKGSPKDPPHTVDIYLLVCTILQLKNCPPTNGSMMRVKELLKDNHNSGGLSLTLITYIATFTFCGLVAVVLCLVALTQITTRYTARNNSHRRQPQQYRVTDMNVNSEVSKQLLNSDTSEQEL